MSETMLRVFEKVHNPVLFSSLVNSEVYYQAEHTVLRNLNFNEKL